MNCYIQIKRKEQGARSRKLPSCPIIFGRINRVCQAEILVFSVFHIAFLCNFQMQAADSLLT